MTWYQKQNIDAFLQNIDYDIRKTHNGRWIDQKCFPDVVSSVAECIIIYRGEEPEVPFTSVDIWKSPYTMDFVQESFRKPSTAEPMARNEYDKFFQQPMELLTYAGILSKERDSRYNFYDIENAELLDFIALRPDNALAFLQRYIWAVINDSGLAPVFERFFEQQTQDAYDLLKNRFTKFTIENTPINGELECHRIFTKVLNPLAFGRGKHGTKKGRISRDVITRDMLNYNQPNFRDLLSGKPKGLTRRQHEANPPARLTKVGIDSTRAKRTVRLHNDTFRSGLSEILDDGHSSDRAVQIHHIFPESRFPELVSHYENLIALTPTQHFSYAHPDGHTGKIDFNYQEKCILAKIETVKTFGKATSEENIYQFSGLLETLSVGLGETKFLEIDDGNYDEVTQLVMNVYRQMGDL
ncbi:MAG: hypothetical protein FWG25_03965 [Promicromonosporaceae bacterium]|nr:hypothetical protein [Promicromonosporaceae bacterium]